MPKRTYRLDSKTQRLVEKTAGGGVVVSIKTDRPPPPPEAKGITSVVGTAVPLLPASTSVVVPKMEELPALLDIETFHLSWACYQKLIHLRDSFPQTEVGWHFLCAEDDPTRFIDIIVPKQTVSSASVDFDAEHKADLMAALFEKGISPHRWMPWWGHSHPGKVATPSGTDQVTFRSTYSQPKLALMFIIGKGIDCEYTANVRINNAPFTHTYAAKCTFQLHPVAENQTPTAQAAAFLSAHKFLTEELQPWLEEAKSRVQTHQIHQGKYYGAQSGNYQPPFAKNRGGGAENELPYDKYYRQGMTAHVFIREHPAIKPIPGIRYGEWTRDCDKHRWVHPSGIEFEYIHQIITNPPLPPAYTGAGVQVPPEATQKALSKHRWSALAELADDLSRNVLPTTETEEMMLAHYLTKYHNLSLDDQQRVDDILLSEYQCEINDKGLHWLGTTQL